MSLPVNASNLKTHRFGSVRAKLFSGFFAMSLIAAALGGYAIYAITAAGQIVVDTYDRPLMAINYARAASAAFTQMQNELLRQEYGVASSERSPAALDGVASELDDDFRVAEERTLTPRSRQAVQTAETLVNAWRSLAHKAIQTPGSVTPYDIDRSSMEIFTAFDTVVELLAEESFTERQKAVKAITVSERLAIGATILALLAAAFIAFFLARRIIWPLAAAAAAAGRIAKGEFEAPIPKGGTDETGALLRSMSIMQQNIHRMMENEKAQRRSAQTRLVEALEGARDAMLLVDSENRIVIANSQVAQFFPELKDQLVEGGFFSPMFAEDGNRESETAPPDGEIHLPDGRWLHLKRSPTREGGSFLFWSDISALKDREEKYFLAKTEAEAASRAKSTFLANISHELRTPLNAIIGFSEIIAKESFGPTGNAAYVEYAGDVLSSGKHLLHVINDVLDIVKSDAGTLELRRQDIDLCDVARECADEVRSQCERANLVLNVSLPTDGAALTADPKRLKQVLLNLLLNAIKFTPKGHVGLSICETEDTVVAEVSDTGIGMNPDDIPKAFEAFIQIDGRLARSFEGTGLGLPLVKTLVDLHGGQVALHSALGQGTQVRICLPKRTRSNTQNAA